MNQNKKNSLRYLIYIAAAFAAFFFKGNDIIMNIKNSEDADKEAFSVERVIDGDTFVLENGQKVRLIGIDAPELEKQGEEGEYYANEARDFLDKLISKKRVYLIKDTSETDKYKRLLRYVYLEDGSFINEILVLEGYAQAKEYKPDVKHFQQLKTAEQKAKKSNEGIWGN